MDATISAGTRSALFALSSMQNQISVMENRLATGKRVNVPTDNANSYFLSAGLSSRAGIGRVKFLLSLDVPAFGSAPK